MVNLRDFLISTGTDEHLAGLILFLAEQARAVKKGFLRTAGKPAGETTRNVYGEEQMPLDTYADSVFVEGLKSSGLARYIATEEQEKVIEVGHPKNNFGIVIDPLDGSSLIDVNFSIGTIIGIYPGHVLDRGSNLIAALYILYGPLTTLTFTTGRGVHEFVMDESGEFVLRQKDLRIPKGMLYAPGALRKDYLPAHRRWIEHLEQDGYKLRFSGCFVADVHQILRKGGVFTYPGIRGKEQGKLRLLYEANPMGMLVREAGGSISNGSSDILMIQPERIDQVTPVYIGGTNEIRLIENYMREG